MAKKKKDKGYYCSECNKLKKAGDFYSMQHKYMQRDNKFTICADCIKNFSYYNPNDRERVELKKFQKILMKLDLPFMKDIYHSAYLSTYDTVGKYINILQFPQYKNKLSWEHSVFSEDIEENDKMKETLVDEVDLMKMIDDQDKVEVIGGYWEFTTVLRDRWGNKYELKDLVELEKIYLKLKSSILIETEMDSINLIDACKAKYMYDEAMVSGDTPANIDKLRKNKDGAFSKLKTIDSGSRAPSLSLLFKQIDETEGGLEILEKWRKYPRDEIDMIAYLIVVKNKEHHGISTDDFSEKDMYNIYERRAKEYKDKLKDEGKQSLLDRITV
jgi:hypothetical protein